VSPVYLFAFWQFELPPPPVPVGSYRPAVRVGPLVWVSGQIAVRAGEVVAPGSVDRDLSVPAAQEVAAHATLQALSAIAQELGSLDTVRRVVRLAVFVSVAPGFHREHEVANGASDLLVRIFGEAGRPTRVTVGVAGLPKNAPVEVELLVEAE
jgi:enamine deaminase RidA (YjgF/YER057c/UK114 family)